MSDKVELSDTKNGKAFAGERAVFGGVNDQFNGAVAFLVFLRHRTRQWLLSRGNWYCVLPGEPLTLFLLNHVR